MSLEDGGMGIGLVPPRLNRLAMFAGMILDVVPGLISLGKEHALPHLSEPEDVLLNAAIGPVEKMPGGGLYSTHCLVLGDWAFRYVLDSLRKLIVCKKEFP